MQCPRLAKVSVLVVQRVPCVENLHTACVMVALHAWQRPLRGARLHLQCRPLPIEQILWSERRMWG